MKQIRDNFTIFLGLPITKENVLNHKMINEYQVIDILNIYDFNYIDNSDITTKKYYTKHEVEQKYFLRENDILIKFIANLEIFYIKSVPKNVLIPSRFIVIRSNSRQNQLGLWYLLNNKYKKILLTKFNANSRTFYIPIRDIADIEMEDDLLNIEQIKIDLYINLQRYKKLSKIKKDLLTKQVYKTLQGE